MNATTSVLGINRQSVVDGFCWDCREPVTERLGWLVCPTDDCARQFQLIAGGLRERTPVPPSLRGRSFLGGTLAACTVVYGGGCMDIDGVSDGVIPITAIFFENELVEAT